MDITYHKIIGHPHTYKIVDLHYRIDINDYQNSYVDLTLVKGSTTRNLRFMEPQNFSVETGFPQPTGGMYIEDISSHGLERINIKVGNFEASHGEITFLAYKVIDLDLVNT